MRICYVRLGLHNDDKSLFMLRESEVGVNSMINDGLSALATAYCCQPFAVIEIICGSGKPLQAQWGG